MAESSQPTNKQHIRKSQVKVLKTSIPINDQNPDDCEPEWQDDDWWPSTCITIDEY